MDMEQYQKCIVYDKLWNEIKKTPRTGAKKIFEHEQYKYIDPVAIIQSASHTKDYLVFYLLIDDIRDNILDEMGLTSPISKKVFNSMPFRDALEHYSICFHETITSLKKIPLAIRFLCSPEQIICLKLIADKSLHHQSLFPIITKKQRELITTLPKEFIESQHSKEILYTFCIQKDNAYTRGARTLTGLLLDWPITRTYNENILYKKYILSLFCIDMLSGFITDSFAQDKSFYNIIKKRSYLSASYLINTCFIDSNFAHRDFINRFPRLQNNYELAVPDNWEEFLTLSDCFNTANLITTGTMHTLLSYSPLERYIRLGGIMIFMLASVCKTLQYPIEYTPKITTIGEIWNHHNKKRFCTLI